LVLFDCCDELQNEFVIICKINLHIEGKLSYSGNISNLLHILDILRKTAVGPTADGINIFYRLK
jgi:hypothetical protein